MCSSPLCSAESGRPLRWTETGTDDKHQDGSRLRETPCHSFFSYKLFISLISATDSKRVLYGSFCEPQVNLSSVGFLVGWAWANHSPPGAEFSHLQEKATCGAWISIPFSSHVDLGTCCISTLWLNLLLIGEFNLNKDYSGDHLRAFSLYFNIHMSSKRRYIEIISTTDQSRGI